MDEDKDLEKRIDEEAQQETKDALRTWATGIGSGLISLGFPYPHPGYLEMGNYFEEKFKDRAGFSGAQMIGQALAIPAYLLVYGPIIYAFTR